MPTKEGNRKLPTAITSVGVDYVSLSSADNRAAYDYCERKFGGADVAGRQAAVLGYVGTATLHAFWGQGPQGYFVRVSSDTANESYQEMLMLPEQRCSRLDVQVTMRLNVRSDIARNKFLEFEKAATSERYLGRLFGWYGNSRGGSTLTVGSRSSERYFRMYNKSAEEGDTEDTTRWRYEVEYKGGLSKKLWAQLRQAETTGHTARFLRLIATEYGRIGANCPFTGNAPVFDLSQARKDTALTDKFNWLFTQVRPTVKSLLESGYEEALMVALGLPGERALRWLEKFRAETQEGGVTDHILTDTPFPSKIEEGYADHIG